MNDDCATECGEPPPRPSSPVILGTYTEVKTLSAFADLVRGEFDFLERRGFRYGGEADRLPAYSEVIYESQRIRVRVYWDGRDHMSWTVLGRRRRFAPFLPLRELGLGHLGEGGESGVLPDFAVNPGPLRASLRQQAHLLETLGTDLLDGVESAWVDLRRLQDASVRRGW